MLRPALLYAGFCLPRFDAGEATISLGQSLLKGSSGGVAGATEPSRTPATQFLLAPPRVYRLLAECPVGPFHFLSFGPRKPEMYVTGLVSVALVLTRVLGISRVGGRYPHGVPLVSGRSSRTASGTSGRPKSRILIMAYFLFFDNQEVGFLRLVGPSQINDDAHQIDPCFVVSRLSSGVEQPPCKRWVRGSIPRGGSIVKIEKCSKICFVARCNAPAGAGASRCSSTPSLSQTHNNPRYP